VKNPYELLQQKETELARLRHEIECLRITACLLDEGPSSENLPSQSESPTETALQHDPETCIGLSPRSRECHG
jgi:hypothetical protein